MTENNEEIEIFYEIITETIKSKEFKVPIKNFVDENCIFFDKAEENSFEHTTIHNVNFFLNKFKRFKNLIEEALGKLLIETGATQEQFLLVANKGLESADKKYYERLIATENYLYFKSMMVKQNLQLEEEAMKLMISKAAKENVDVVGQKNEWEKFQNKKYEVELGCAIQMSLALEEEKKKLKELEEEELRKILELSKLDQQSLSKISAKADFSGTIKISNQTIIEDKATLNKNNIEISSGSNLEIVASNAAKKEQEIKDDNKKLYLLLEKNNEINIINNSKNNDERRNLENVKINKDKTNTVNLAKYINEKDKNKADSENKKEIFLNDPDKQEENAWKKHMDKLGINQLKPKEVKKEDSVQNKNKYDDEFNQVFEVSEKLTFKEEEIPKPTPKKEEGEEEIINCSKDKKEAEKIKSESNNGRENQKDKQEIKTEKKIEAEKKEEIPVVKKLDDVKKKKNIDKAIALELLKVEESSKIVKDEMLKSSEKNENQKDNLIKINPIAKAEEKSDLKAINKDLNDLLNLQKNESKKEIEVNAVKDEVELRKIDWESNNNLINFDNNNNNNNNNKDFAQTSSNFRLSDTLNMKRLEKNYQINHEIPDVSNVKSKIDTGLRKSNNFNKTGMMNNFFKKSDDNSNNNKGKLNSYNANKLEGSLNNNEDQEAFEYQKLEKDNKNELKQFIQTVMANKKEKRNNYFDQNNVKKADVNKELELKKLEMRKKLAEQLKIK